jgi:hypothetical protein
MLHFASGNPGATVPRVLQQSLVLGHVALPVAPAGAGEEEAEETQQSFPFIQLGVHSQCS